MKTKNYLKKGCGCLSGAVVLAVVIGAIVMYVLKPKWHDEYGQRFQDISYGSRQHNTYDLYLPNDAEKNDSPSEPRRSSHHNAHLCHRLTRNRREHIG